MSEKRHMKIIIEFNDGVSYELNEKQLNPK